MVSDPNSTLCYLSLGPSPIVSDHCGPEIHAVFGASHLGLKVRGGSNGYMTYTALRHTSGQINPNHTIILYAPYINPNLTWSFKSWEYVKKSFFGSALDASKKPVLWESRGSGTDRSRFSSKIQLEMHATYSFHGCGGAGDNFSRFAGIIDPVSAPLGQNRKVL